MLTTGLDNLLGTNGNDVVLAVLDGSDSTLELDDAFNSLLGQDTLRLDSVEADSNVNFDSADYHFVGFERVLVQARADNLDISLDLDDMAGVDLEVRNMLSDFDGAPWENAELYAENIGGDALVVNFDGYELDLNNVGGDIVLRDIYVDNNNNGNGVDINTVGGDVLIENFELNNANLEIDNVSGNVVLTGDVDSNGNINSNIDNNVNIDGVGGNVTISNVDFDGNLNIADVSGNTISFSNVDTNDNIDITFADTVSSATINLNGLDSSDGEYIDVDGEGVTNYTINVTADSDINDLHFSHNNDSLSQITINLTGADLYVEDFQVATAALDEIGNSYDIPSTMTIAGTGNLVVDNIEDDDNLDIIYTGTGSIDIGSEGEWEPANGSFNASTATGDVTIELDLNEHADLDFTYVGSKGDDRVVIEEDSLGDTDAVVLSLAGGTGVDTFVVSDDTDLTAAALAHVSGFEVLELANSADDEGDNAYIDSVMAVYEDTEGLVTGRVYDLEDADEFSSIVVDTQGSDDNLALINLTAQQATHLTFNYDLADSLDGIIIDLEDQTGVSDVVSMTIVTDESNGEYTGEFVDGYMSINDVETINFNITGDAFYKDVDGNYITDGDDIFVGVQALVAEEVEKINITGSVSFGIGSIGFTEYNVMDGNEINSDLREIDATQFTGQELVLGGGMGPIGIYTEDDLIIRGSAVSDHYIAAWSEEDITVTTGDGNDNMWLIAQDDITVTSGSGDDDMNVNANGDVVVDSGNDDDNVFVSASIDASITLGSGDDEFDYDYNDIYGDLTVDAGAGDDNININLDSDANLVSATVTLGAGADDLYLGSTRFDAFEGQDIVVTVTDFAVADDVLYLDEDAEGVVWSGVEGDAYEADYVTVGTQDGDYDVTDGVSSDDIGLIEFTFDADNNGVELDILSTGADLLEALGDDGDSAIITVNNDQDGYIVAYNGGNAYIFNYETDIDGLPTATLTNGTSNTAVITFTEGTGDGWEAGDVITISGLVMAATDGADEGGTAGDDFDEWAASGSFTYTVEADDTITDIANAIANGITNYTDSDYTASFAGGVVTIYDGSNSVYDPENFVTVSFTEATETDTVIQEDQIELIGVLENVAVGSLSTANFGFYDWTVA